MTVQKINSDSEIIKKYVSETKSESFSIVEKSNFNYFALISDSHVDIQFQTEWGNIQWNIFVVCFWRWNVSSNIKTFVNNSNTKINVFILSFLQDNNEINVNWDIIMGKWTTNSQWHLLEKNVIIWKKIKTKVSPRLDVYSQNTQSTHGVSIDKIDPEKKFYLQSRGLNSQETMELSIHWYIQYILDYFKDTTEQEKNDIENLILSSIQIND